MSRHWFLRTCAAGRSLLRRHELYRAKFPSPHWSTAHIQADRPCLFCTQSLCACICLQHCWFRCKFAKDGWFVCRGCLFGQCCGTLCRCRGTQSSKTAHYSSTVWYSRLLAAHFQFIAYLWIPVQIINKRRLKHNTFTRYKQKSWDIQKDIPKCFQWAWLTRRIGQSFPIGCTWEFACRPSFSAWHWRCSWWNFPCQGFPNSTNSLCHFRSAGGDSSQGPVPFWPNRKPNVAAFPSWCRGWLSRQLHPWSATIGCYPDSTRQNWAANLRRCFWKCLHWRAFVQDQFFRWYLDRHLQLLRRTVIAR